LRITSVFCGLLVFSALFLFSSNVSFAQTAKAFKFNPARVRTGTLYQYRKSNLDGTHPDTVFIYVADQTHLDVLKLEPGVTTGVNIEAELDWQTFMPKKLQMYHDRQDGLHIPIFHLTTVGNQAVLTADNLASMNPHAAAIVGKEQRLKITSPSHVYGFELISFNFAIQHLRKPKSNFVVGMMGDNQNFGPDSPSPIAYFGEAKVDYLATEKRDGISVHKYKLSGAAFNGKEGFFWTDAKLGHITDIEMPVANNGDWDNFKLKLVKMENLNAAAWRKRKGEQLRNFFANSGKAKD
jgi:hypothetical protein